MKKLGLFIGILLLVSKSFYGQTITGAIASVPDGGSPNSPNTDALAGCDNGCDEQTMYNWFAPMSGNVCDGTSVTGNYGGGSPGTHWPMQISVLVPSGCTVTAIAEYGGPCNKATGGICDGTTAHCNDSQMDDGGPDVFGINNGFNSPGTTTSGQSGSGCIGVCSAGASGLTGTLNGGSTNLNGTSGAPGCFMTSSGGNSDVICTASGITNTSITIWGMSNRGDEIITYTVTGTGSCGTLGFVVLPVEIIGIGAYRNDNGITVGWSTATETNNNYFMVEYSIDGTNFINYKEVKGAGNSNSRRDYTCNFMEDIGSYTPYFRLKQVDYNGNFKYSPIVTLGTMIGSPKSLSLVNAFYNTDNSSIVSKFKLGAPAQISFSLYNISGQEVYASTNIFNEGNNEFSIPAPDVSGVYILLYQNGSSAPVHKKVMVTK
jgi:hypothetical protein